MADRFRCFVFGSRRSVAEAVVTVTIALSAEGAAAGAVPLGRRPYDLRHAAVSLWLNSDAPTTEVARRAGHGVLVLLKIYAHCIDGQATAANQRIADALGSQDAEEDPGDEGDGDTEQAS